MAESSWPVSSKSGLQHRSRSLAASYGKQKSSCSMIRTIFILIVTSVYKSVHGQGFENLGCYEGERNTYLPFESPSEATPQWCRNVCGPQVFGMLRAGPIKVYCHCADLGPNLADDAACNRRCGPDDSIVCGGYNSDTKQWYISHYKEDTDECNDGTHECEQICHNTIGSYTCSCRQGYLPNSDGRTCTDVDECEEKTDDCAHVCTNTPGSYGCYCDDGYTSDDNGRTCSDIDECAENTDDCNQNCANTEGSYSCVCLNGYRLDNDGHTCLDIDECGEDTDGCDQRCNNTVGSYDCWCGGGYRLDGDGRTCEDIDECSMEPAFCTQTCLNTAGSFNCTCGPGFLLNETDRRTCSVAPAPTPGNMAATGAAIGGGVGGALAAIAVGLTVFFVLRKRRRKSKSANKTLLNQTPSGPGLDAADMPDASKDPGDGLHVEIIPTLKAVTPNDVIVECAYENIVQQQRNTRVEVSRIAPYVDSLKQGKAMEEEFKKLIDGSGVAVEAAKRGGLSKKNKFKNILPYDVTRVKLTKQAGEECSDYINASYIKVYDDKELFIAAMGPRRPTLEDFWRLVWEQNVALVVMVTNLKEGGVLKCEQYWPDEGSTEYGKVTVKLDKEDKWLDVVRRQLTITCGGRTKSVLQLHFTAWPDHGVPTNPTSMTNFVRQVERNMVPNRYTLVHCSAGVGRTGTWLALHQLMQQAQKEGAVDVFTCVNKLRQQRMNMVQTQSQYAFIHEALAEVLTTGTTTIACDTFPEVFKDLVAKESNGNCRLEKQFKVLKESKTEAAQGGNEDFMNEANKDKNRVPLVAPSSYKRIYLSERFPGRNDYINAVGVDTYRKQDGMLVTQIPLERTVVDFWRMAFDYDCRCLIVLHRPTDSKDKPQFIPERNRPLAFQKLRITHIGSEVVEEMDTTDLSLERAEHDLVETEAVYANTGLQGNHMKVFQVETDAGGQFTPHQLIDLFVAVEKWQHNNGDHCVIITCLNGADLSGQYAVCSNMFEMVNTEAEVDIFQLVRQAKKSRPEFINSMAEYNFLHKVVQEYIKSFAAYSNLK